MVWAESSFNGLVSLYGLVWFGGKWGKMSSLVWSDTTCIWSGFGSGWDFKWLFAESAHSNFPTTGWRSYDCPSSSTSSQEHRTCLVLIGRIPRGAHRRTAAWTPTVVGAATLAASTAATAGGRCSGSFTSVSERCPELKLSSWWWRPSQPWS